MDFNSDMFFGMLAARKSARFWLLFQRTRMNMLCYLCCVTVDCLFAMKRFFCIYFKNKTCINCSPCTRLTQIAHPCHEEGHRMLGTARDAKIDCVTNAYSSNDPGKPDLTDFAAFSMLTITRHAISCK